jgi:hypothetical protein
MNFSFRTTENTQHFCQQIVKCLVRFGSVSTDEAVSLVNAYWAERPALDENDLRLHENPYFWAMCILYPGNAGYDWTRDPCRNNTPADLSEKWYGASGSSPG